MPVGERAQRRVRFRSVVSPDSYISICGFSFLLSEKIIVNLKTEVLVTYRFLVFPESLDEELFVNSAVSALFLNVKTATVTAYIVVFGTRLVAAFLFPDLMKNDLFSSKLNG
ncbi:hypothetical protein AHAS_Ahas12G0178400 [Arachis hypogaea]